MSIQQVVTRGFGNGTFTGVVGKVVTRGYGISDAAPVLPPTGGGGPPGGAKFLSVDGKPEDWVAKRREMILREDEVIIEVLMQAMEVIIK